MCRDHNGHTDPKDSYLAGKDRKKSADIILLPPVTGAMGRRGRPSIEVSTGARSERPPNKVAPESTGKQ